MPSAAETSGTVSSTTLKVLEGLSTPSHRGCICSQNLMGLEHKFLSFWAAGIPQHSSQLLALKSILLGSWPPNIYQPPHKSILLPVHKRESHKRLEPLSWRDPKGTFLGHAQACCSARRWETRDPSLLSLLSVTSDLWQLMSLYKHLHINIRPCIQLGPKKIFKGIIVKRRIGKSSKI